MSDVRLEVTRTERYTLRYSDLLECMITEKTESGKWPEDMDDLLTATVQMVDFGGGRSSNQNLEEEARVRLNGLLEGWEIPDDLSDRLTVITQ
jgi:hypothetical protein